MATPSLESTAPIQKGVAVTPADATRFAACRCLNVTTAGAATLVWPDGTTSAWYLTAGYNPVTVVGVYSTGLTAATIVAGY